VRNSAGRCAASAVWPAAGCDPPAVVTRRQAFEDPVEIFAQPHALGPLGAIGLFELVDLGKQPDHAAGKRVERAIVVTR